MNKPSIEKRIQADVSTLSAFDETEQLHKKDVLEWIASGANLFRIKKPALASYWRACLEE